MRYAARLHPFQLEETQHAIPEYCQNASQFRFFSQTNAVIFIESEIQCTVHRISLRDAIIFKPQFTRREIFYICNNIDIE